MLLLLKITSLDIVLSSILFYYCYKLQLRTSSKIKGTVLLIVLMLFVGAGIPFISIYISTIVGWEIKSSSDEIGLIFSLYSTMISNLLLGILFIIKFLLTHNKNVWT